MLMKLFALNIFDEFRVKCISVHAMQLMLRMIVYFCMCVSTKYSTIWDGFLHIIRMHRVQPDTRGS